MEQETFDKEVKQYFQHHKRDIEDNGFSQKVIKKIPGKEPSYFPVYIMLLAGIGIFLFFNGFQDLLSVIYQLTDKIQHMQLQHISIYTLVILPLVLLLLLVVDREDLWSTF